MEDKLTFEQAQSRLEEIVNSLQKGDCTLDDTIKMYDEGLKLAKFCTEKLEKAEQKVMSIEEYMKESQKSE